MQDFSPVEYTTGELGKFYIGDSYIILRTQVPSSIIIIIIIITIIIVIIIIIIIVIIIFYGKV